MAVFLLFYKLFLEQENMHVFKRFFLLTAIVASFLIPSIVFTSYVETVSENIENMANVPYVAVVSNEPKDLDMINWNLIMTTAYVIGVVFFGFRFFRNLFQILRRIKRNPNFKAASSVRVLLKEVLPPHTFLSYIFLNKKKYEENAIPKEVLLHEETHAKQRHSLDVLFVEFLQVILWFNPLVYLYKKAIKLNHEFLADNAVLQQEIHTKNYQNTLLSYLSKESLEKYQSTGIANAINYSSIKKRFTVMKKRTSKKAAVLRGLLVFPLLALLLYSFTETKIIEIQSKKAVPNSGYSPYQKVKGEIYQKATAKDFAKWIDAKEYALWLDDKNINNTALKNLDPNQIVHFVSSFVYENARSTKYPQPFQVHLYTKNGLEKIVYQNENLIEININNKGQLLVQEELVPLGNLPEFLSKINQHLSFNQRKKVLHFIIKVDFKTPKDVIKQVNQIVTDYGSAIIEIIGPENSSQPSKQRNITRAEIKEYNALAKKYNEMDSDRMRILKSDVERLEFIYSLMSDKQKADAEPFPDFPEPPPAPNAENSINSPVAPKSPGVLKGRVSNVPPPPNVNHPKTITGRVSKVPAPPQPMDPLDHVVNMAKKGAIFFYEGKEISSDKAIKLIKNNKNFNISTTKSNSKKPKVKISKEPISIKSSSSGINLETGNIKVNGKELFYSTKNGITSYFNESGQQVDKKGEKLTSLNKQNPTFYFNGNKISSEKAHRLLRNNKSIQVTTETYSDEEYAIVLSDLSKSSDNTNYNHNPNPNSAIDLTEMIAKEALFFYNNKPISAEKALWLTQNEHIDRVNNVGSKTGKPKVYLWKKV